MPYRRNYPATVQEVLDPAAKYKGATLQAVRAFARSKPFNVIRNLAMEKSDAVSSDQAKAAAKLPGDASQADLASEARGGNLRTEDAKAEELHQAAVKPFTFNKSVIKLPTNEAVAQYLPPVLASTIPELPAVKEKKSVAIICSGTSCQPPISDPAQLSRALREVLTPH